jgi:alpha-D-xyloside xylohydrolase
MKFTHGAWQLARGVTATPIKRLYDYRIEDGTLWIAALDRHGNEGSDRFEGLVLQVRVTSPLPDVLRVQVTHHHRELLKFPIEPALHAGPVQTEDHPNFITFTSGKLSLRISKPHWTMSFESDGRVITRSGPDQLAHMRLADGSSHLMQRLSLTVGECIYGMGERFGPLVRNGQSVEIWNEDGGTTSDLSYKNIPFYLSSAGYGVMINHPGKVEFEVGTERVSQIQFSVPGEELDYYFFYGPQPKDVLEKYTAIAGRPPELPDWSYGLWLSTSFTTQYDESTVMNFLDGMAERGIPLSVFHFDCFWMRERHWCDFEWDRNAFPDPEGMLRRIKDRGLKICVWINPYISQLSKLFDEGRCGGYLLRRPDGSIYQVDQWQPGMALVDFTNPAAVAWYQTKLQALLDMGIDTFKTDFGERIPTDVVYHSGANPVEMHNFYTHLYNQCVFSVLEKHHGKGQAMVFARSATLGAQQFPVHWGGDCDATFESMAEDLRGGLSFCLSGPAYWSHDIGGFAGKADPAIYKRWAAFGLLSTHSRLHGSESYRVPWLFDEESVDVVRLFSRLKNCLSPYLLSAARDARERGWPVMRAMLLEFPHNPTCLHLDRQYMLGDSLLVAPIFREDHIAEYYLPAGEWTDVLSDDPVIGGRWVREKVGFLEIPLLARPNSIIPMSRNDESPGWLVEDPLTLNLYSIESGCDIQTRVATSDGKSVYFTCRRERNVILLTSDGQATKVDVRFRGSTIEWPETSKPLSLLTEPTGSSPVESVGDEITLRN